MPSRLAATLGLVLLAACSSSAAADAGDGETGGDASQRPADSSRAAIEAFLATQVHRDWHADPAIRTSNNASNPHGEALRVFFNDAATASGNAMSPAAGSMIVKEFHDSNGALLGTAVRLKTATGEWVHYCTNVGGSLCGAEGEPVYGVDSETACGFCHVDRIFAAMP
jgi:hypothetical protein